jgi:hypothetical protein
VAAYSAFIGRDRLGAIGPITKNLQFFQRLSKVPLSSQMGGFFMTDTLLNQKPELFMAWIEAAEKNLIADAAHGPEIPATHHTLHEMTEWALLLGHQ